MCPSPLGVQLRDEALVLAAELRADDAADRLLATHQVVVTPR